ncbi:MAG: glutathione S-transferase [Alteromonadaceae bacterium]|nr:MAG: glutathione S-transferase [Alteromonadaceae bacterium]
MPSYVSALYIALSTIFILALAYRVTVFRRTYKVGIGAGDNQDLDVAIRCHANTIENLPLALLLLLMAELSGLPALTVHAAGSVLLVMRAYYALGMTGTRGGYSRGRFIGTLGTWTVMLVLSGFIIFQFIAAQ